MAGPMRARDDAARYAKRLDEAGAKIARLEAALRSRTRQRIRAESEVYMLRKALGLRAEPVNADPG